LLQLVKLHSFNRQYSQVPTRKELALVLQAWLKP
jgi:hypothetical protein